jgi:hypothetical protein
MRSEEGEAHLSNAVKILRFMINFFSLLPLATKVLLHKTLFRYPHPLLVSSEQLAISSEQLAVRSEQLAITSEE